MDLKRLNSCCGLGLAMLVVVACAKLPQNFTVGSDKLTLMPDYSNTVVPYNIAPLNFKIGNEADAVVTSIYSSKGTPIVVSGNALDIDVDDWNKLLNDNKGEVLHFDIFLKTNNSWSKYHFQDTISNESIDNYLSYRLICPSYELYGEMTINQRNLTNFDERKVYSNKAHGQCVNCHSYQNYNKSGNMQLHVRGDLGGTLIVKDGTVEKVNFKTPNMPGGAVYPAWHPTLNLIAYSSNKISQTFHTRDVQKVEVLDTYSDLLLYDADRNEVKYILKTDDNLETFPYWSPDGKYLYFVSAHFKPTSDNVFKEASDGFKDMKYNILRIPFDLQTKTFGAVDTVFNAVSIHKSGTFPRVSPDGKYLMFTLADYGNFHIWHKSSDLYLMDLATKKWSNLSMLNSPEVESYHSWSSNGRWVVFSSRRQDGSYTRLYISYFDANGNAHKPILLPQKDVDSDALLFMSYNIPEFTVNPVEHSTRDFDLVGQPKEVGFSSR